MESYVSYFELKNKWQSQKISKKYKNRHIKKSKPCRNQYKANKRKNNKKKRHSQNASASNLHQTNITNNAEQQFIFQNYHNINVTINISIYYHCERLKKNQKQKTKKVKKNMHRVQTEKVELTKTEENAVLFVQKKSMASSINREKHLIKKLSKLNFDKTRRNRNILETVYNKLMHFMSNKVPMIIHVTPCTISKLLNDTHYRNLFEIGTGNGCIDQNIRKKYETEMFHDCYSMRNVKATEKPKYGCLNIGLNKNGIQSAYGYGRAYMTLNDATVRWRVSLTNQDSFDSNGVFGTMNNCAHLLANLNDDELQEICDTAMYKTVQNTYRRYREIQIHGPVLLKRDIASLHVPTSEMRNRHIYEKFAANNSCDLIWF